jgi:hypothetical protein
VDVIIPNRLSLRARLLCLRIAWGQGDYRNSLKVLFCGRTRKMPAPERSEP